jgi:hypothetical protein
MPASPTPTEAGRLLNSWLLKGSGKDPSRFSSPTPTALILAIGSIRPVTLQNRR